MKIKAPIIQQQEITTECNNFCKFCYNPERCQKEFDLRLEDKKRNILIAETSVTNGVMAVCLTGGEPLLIKNHLYDLLKIYREAGCYTSINSNGRLVINDVAEKLFLLGLKSALVSLHGIGELHDKMVRDKNAFNETWQGLLNLRKNNIPVTPNFVATKQNIYGLLEVGRKLAENGFKSMTVTPFLPSFGAINHRDFVLSKEDYQQYFLTVKKIRELGIKIDSTLPIPPCLLIKFFPGNWQDFVEVHTPRVCMAGRSFGVISTNGLFRSCIQAPYLPEFGGDMLKNYKESWQKAGDWADKKLIPNNCLSCFALSVCGAGCRTGCLWANNGSVEGETMYMGKPLTAEQGAYFIDRVKIELVNNNNKYFKWGENIKFRKEDGGLIVFNPANQSFTVLSNLINKQPDPSSIIKFDKNKTSNVLYAIGAIKPVKFRREDDIFMDNSVILQANDLFPRLANNLIADDKVYYLRADTGERYYF